MDAFQAELADAQTTAVVIEFGTRSRQDMQRANLSLCWLRRRGGDDPEMAKKVRSDYVEAFYPSAPEWRDAVLAQSRVFLDQAVAGIAR